MNNKRLGTEFENEVCQLLSKLGYWVHFFAPDARGAQPFDIIAAKNGRTLAIDCKTCVANTFSISRLEDNQISAFDLWLKTGNSEPMLFVKHDDVIHVVYYEHLKRVGSVKLKNCAVKMLPDGLFFLTEDAELPL